MTLESIKQSQAYYWYLITICGMMYLVGEVLRRDSIIQFSAETSREEERKY
jgi:hypothetical protein